MKTRTFNENSEKVFLI